MPNSNYSVSLVLVLCCIFELLILRAPITVRQSVTIFMCIHGNAPDGPTRCHTLVYLQFAN